MREKIEESRGLTNSLVRRAEMIKIILPSKKKPSGALKLYSDSYAMVEIII